MTNILFDRKCQKKSCLNIAPTKSEHCSTSRVVDYYDERVDNDLHDQRGQSCKNEKHARINPRLVDAFVMHDFFHFFVKISSSG